MPASVAARARAAAGGALSVHEVAVAALAAIAARDPVLRAFTAVDEPAVLRDAAALDAALRHGEPPGPLLGTTVAVKDLVDVAGLPTSLGTRAVPARVPERDAPVVARLRAAGALVLGKTRTAELAGSTTTPPTVNPADPTLIAGGSSGGSAAAVGGGLAVGAVGTDTACSVRLPAALCGIVGIKPTFGAVGRSGVLVASDSLDHVGPLAATVADVRALLTAMVGHDPGDSASAQEPALEQLRARLESPRPRDLTGARLGIVDDELFEVVEPRARHGWDAAVAQLTAAGADVVPVALPQSRHVAGALLAIDLPEWAAAYTGWLQAGAPISPDIASMLRVAHAVPAILTMRAHAARHEIAAAVATAFGELGLDALLTPATTAGAIRTDDLERAFEREDHRREPAVWGYPRPFWLASLTGQPAIVLPTVREPPPLSIQLVGRPFADAELLDLAAAAESALTPLADSVP